MLCCVYCVCAAAQESEIEIGEGEYAIESSAPKCDATDDATSDVNRGEIIGSERFIFSSARKTVCCQGDSIS